ncbi:hypothetical protein TraAM80_00091 [Trypanosoma rangeli]|uniref:Translocon-associated protein subunit beta n=1 Tax=Trypanosoma rangeli TaxID=5698 RepID=A0A422P4T9_TRYRA|nr:uncharacterized protein TraAM80_00091 [Trypanosoma rangeli]RNF12739.1 hypothetical protein TraAM80_00091 [Trypanosoma rangeli]|eukprot:RNF12739.1 hypothetical protein TraAM80_00091 [Trypanosoma rangeli]
MNRFAVPLFIAWVLLALFIVPFSAFSAHAEKSMNIAGSVSVPEKVSQYIDVQVIDGSNGAVFRYQPLDATRSFAFTGLPLTATEVRLFLRLPERKFRLDSAASSLSARIPHAASNADVAWLHLTAAVEEVSSAAPKGQLQGGSVLTAAITVIGLAMVALGRHRLLSLLQLPSVKVPKARKVIVTSGR